MAWIVCVISPTAQYTIADAKNEPRHLWPILYRRFLYFETAQWWAERHFMDRENNVNWRYLIFKEE
jgi:hypothetical protein